MKLSHTFIEIKKNRLIFALLLTASINWHFQQNKMLNMTIRPPVMNNRQPQSQIQENIKEVFWDGHIFWDDENYEVKRRRLR